MATIDDVKNNILEDVSSGVAEKQLDDRRTRKEDPLKRLQAMRELAADLSPSGPIIRIGFRRRG